MAASASSSASAGRSLSRAIPSPWLAGCGLCPVRVSVGVAVPVPVPVSVSVLRSLVALHDKHEREHRQQFLVEGVRCISHLVSCGWKPLRILLRHDRIPNKHTIQTHNTTRTQPPSTSQPQRQPQPQQQQLSHPPTQQRGGCPPVVSLFPSAVAVCSPVCLWLSRCLDVPVLSLTRAQFDGKLSQHDTPSGYAAHFAMPARGGAGAGAGAGAPVWANTPDWSGGGLILDRVREPGNVGTIIRTAVATGFTQIVLVSCCDLFNAKLVQATAGAIANITPFTCTHIQQLLPNNNNTPPPWLSALVVSGGVPLPLSPDPLSIALSSRSDSGSGSGSRGRWLVIGSEADGISHDLLSRCQQRVTIPMSHPTLDSLNVATAAAIACYVLKPNPNPEPDPTSTPNISPTL